MWSASGDPRAGDPRGSVSIRLLDLAGLAWAHSRSCAPGLALSAWERESGRGPLNGLAGSSWFYVVLFHPRFRISYIVSYTGQPRESSRLAENQSR